MVTVILTAFALILSLLLYFHKIQPDNFPPGPSGVPVLGYIPFLQSPLHKKFEELSKLYGKIFGVVLANYRVVVVSDSKILKKLFNDDRLMGRPGFEALAALLYPENTRGLVAASGTTYLEQRNFVSKIFKGFGLGKSSHEEHILVEVRDLISQFRNNLNKPVIVIPGIKMALLNVLWCTMSGARYSHDDPEMCQLFAVITRIFEGSYFFPLILPKLAKAFPRLTGYQNAIDPINMLREFLQKAIDAHQKNLDPNDPQCLIDIYLNKIHSTKDKNSSFYSGKGEKQLQGLLTDLIAAGNGPPADVLNSALLHLTHSPRVQEKLYNEVVSVVGPSAARLPSLSDWEKMPFAQAVISESMRISAVAPLGAPHMATETFEFEGYTIPKDTLVLANMWQMQHDAEYWGDPEAFRPERFLTDEGQYRIHEGFFPFSIGKRYCVGEAMARNEIFLFLTGLIQHFQFSINQDNQSTLAFHENGHSRTPKPFEVIITERE